jgi:hypothetical protein
LRNKVVVDAAVSGGNHYLNDRVRRLSAITVMVGRNRELLVCGATGKARLLLLFW